MNTRNILQVRSSKLGSALLAFVATPLIHMPVMAQTAQSIKGTVTVSPEMSKKVTPTAVLFVIARPQGAQGGPPAAVVRIASPKFPQTFELGPQNMMAGGEFKGPYGLSAKLSKKGDAMTSPGDLLGNSEDKKGHSAGAKDVQIVLNKEAP